MIRRIIGPLPTWAERKHPVLRYELNRQQPTVSVQGIALRIVGGVMSLAVLALLGYLWATNGLQDDPGINPADAIWRILLFPTLFVQTLTVIAAFSLGVEAISDERRRQTWDNLRATPQGATLALRTRWVAVFYRVRSGLLLVIATRLLLVGVVMYQLTSHRGAYLDILTANITPETSLALGVILLATMITASFLLPLTTVGAEAALGLLISATIRNRTFSALLQVLYLLARLAVGAFLLWAITQMLAGEFIVGDAVAWLLVVSSAAFADGGVLLMHLDEAGELWARVPYGVYFGVALLLFALVQALIADGLVALAVRQAERRE